MLKIDRRLIKNFDWFTFGIIMTLSLIGIMTIFSATRPPLESTAHPDFYQKQILWLIIGIAALLIIVSIDYIWFYRFAYPFYAIGIFLLIAVLFTGKTSMGAQRWLNIGFFSFQPSEFFRLIFIQIGRAHV